MLRDWLSLISLAYLVQRVALQGNIGHISLIALYEQGESRPTIRGKLPPR